MCPIQLPLHRQSSASLALLALKLLLVLLTTGCLVDNRLTKERPADSSLTLQVTVVYYGVALLLHCLVPAALPVKSIQAQPRQPGQASREALYSLGAHAERPASVRAHSRELG